MIRLALILVLAAFRAVAAPIGVADASLGETIAAGSWRTVAAEEVLGAVCGSGSGMALLSRTPTRDEVAACAPSAVAMRIGRQAVYLAARGDSGLRSLTSDQLFRALVARGADAPATWNALDPALPPVPIRVLLPAEGSGLGHLFAATVLEAGCLRDPWLRAIYDVADRQAACTAMRDDGAVVRRTGLPDIAEWMQGEPKGAIAVVTAAEIDRLPEDVAALALDGVVPTFNAVASGAYGGSLPLTMVLVPGSGESRRMTLDAAATVIGEGSLGPAGTLVAAGMVPLPAPDRVALRARLASLGAYR